MGEMITLQTSDGFELGAYRAPAEGSRKGGIVLVMEIFGVTDHIKEISDRWAAEGYDVIAPQLYDREVRDYQTGYSQDELQDAIARATACAGRFDKTAIDMQACIDALEGPVFVTGFCFGGAVSWLAACRCSGLAASAPYYGRLIINLMDETPHCPVMCHFGEKDPTIPLEDVERLRVKHPEITIHIYEGADHGFQSDRPDHYDEAAATLAWGRTKEFFAANTQQ